MCKVNRKRNNGVKVLKAHENKVIGVRVELTKMTAKSGAIVYATLVRNMKTGRYYRIFKYGDGIGKAWQKYKAAIA